MKFILNFEIIFDASFYTLSGNEIVSLHQKTNIIFLDGHENKYF